MKSLAVKVFFMLDMHVGDQNFSGNNTPGPFTGGAILKRDSLPLEPPDLKTSISEGTTNYHSYKRKIWIRNGME
jgi:hypothetical protein